MTRTVFVDTNILVYARDCSEPQKHARAMAALRGLWASRRGTVSDQALQEYYVTVTRKWKPGRAVALARNDLRQLGVWPVVTTDLPLRQIAWDIDERTQLSYWDAMIVAAALRGGRQWLLSEDWQHGMQIESVTVYDPLIHPLEPSQ